MSDIRPAYQGELMLAGWTESHNAGAKVTFMLPDQQALESFRYLTVRKRNMAGQRFMAVLVQIGDDEQPITPGSDNAMQAHGTSRSAALLCKAEDFQRFVASKLGYWLDKPEEREERTAQYVREWCRIDSRSELDKSPTAAQLFSQLMAEYRAWLTPNFG